jgi:pimeloyl-ACP methyl ester carboxylesterase
LACSCFLTSLALSQAVNEYSCFPKIVLGFGNGIQNDRVEAQSSIDKLWDLNSVVVSRSEEKILFYHQKGRNNAEGAIASRRMDVLELYWLQAMASVNNDPQYEELAIAAFHGATMSDKFAGLGNLFAGFVGFAIKAETQIQSEAMLDHTREAVNAEIAEDVSAIGEIVATGSKLLLVAHSQGTLFANAALQKYAEQDAAGAKKLRLVSTGMVADRVWQTPESTLVNEYVTSNSDAVINSWRDVSKARGLPVPLASNSDVLPDAPISAPGHGFIDVYLNTSYEPGQRVMAAVEKAFKQFVSEPLDPFSILAQTQVDIDIGSWGLATINTGSWVIEEGEDVVEVGGVKLAKGQTQRMSAQVYRDSVTIYCSALPAGDLVNFEYPLGFAVPANIAAPSSARGYIDAGGKRSEVNVTQFKAPVSTPDMPEFPEYIYARVKVNRTGETTRVSISGP